MNNATQILEFTSIAQPAPQATPQAPDGPTLSFRSLATHGRVLRASTARDTAYARVTAERVLTFASLLK